MAKVFKYDLAPEPNSENLGGLIGEIGKSKELQQNLPRVQEVLGSDQNAITIARDWVKRTGLLVSVERSLMAPVQQPFPVIPEKSVLVMTGGVRNWMQQRAEVALTLEKRRLVKSAIIAVGNRAMRGVEGSDVSAGMTETTYMDNVIVPMLEEAGIATTMVRVPSTDGSEVMAAAAECVSHNTEAEPIIVVGNAPAAIQMGAQFRHAMQIVAKRELFTFDPDGSELYIASTHEALLLGKTGQEPTATHQNPFTALGQIARNAKFLADLQQR